MASKSSGGADRRHVRRERSELVQDLPGAPDCFSRRTNVGLEWLVVTLSLVPDGCTLVAISMADVDRTCIGLKTVNIPIPSCVENGDYLLRAEHIALHSANSVGGAQFYISCAQVTISGGSGTAKPQKVSIPGVYSANDPGILINLYYPKPTSYTPAGPAPLTC